MRKNCPSNIALSAIEEFKAALKKQRDLVIEDALEVLKRNITVAVDTLIGLLRTTESETLKRLICNDIINHTIKSKEIEDLEKRIGLAPSLNCDYLMVAKQATPGKNERCQARAANSPRHWWHQEHPVVDVCSTNTKTVFSSVAQQGEQQQV